MVLGWFLAISLVALMTAYIVVFLCFNSRKTEFVLDCLSIADLIAVLIFIILMAASENQKYIETRFQNDKICQNADYDKSAYVQDLNIWTCIDDNKNIINIEKLDKLGVP